MPSPLPIDPFLPRATALLRASPSLVLVADPGAGKTTRVPPAILRADLLDKEHPNLVMLQPRRVAARAAARRIADERHWTLGREVGYHVRFDRKLTDATRLRVLTEGILTRQLLDDPFLEGTGAVILDEFHERSLHTDIAAALLREVQQTVRPDLILVVMSATLDADPVSKFLGNCPILKVPGRTHPVTITYSIPSTALLEHRIHDAVASVLKKGTGVISPAPSPSPGTPGEGRGEGRAPRACDSGDLLVFLPGANEIHKSARELQPLARDHDLLILPLHGSLSAEDQDRALQPATKRKVILATNIAETSLTIDGVRTVIDAGLARVPHYDPDRGLDRLDLRRISKASATQRAGRAGRTAPGHCLRLWTEKEHATLDDFDLPEIKRVDLAGTILSLHAWGRPDVRTFNWYEPPTEESVTAAERLLTLLGALTPSLSPSPGTPGEGRGEGRGAAEVSASQSSVLSTRSFSITPLGKRLNALPLHPRLARLLLAANDAGLPRQGATLAALLSEKDVLFTNRDRATVQSDSDLLYRLHLLDSRSAQLDPAAVRPVLQLRDELLRLMSNADLRMPHDDTRDRLSFDIRHSQIGIDEALLKLLLLAYPDRVARRRDPQSDTALAVGGVALRIARESVVKQGEFFLALDARRDDRSQRNEALVRQASRIEEGWLEQLFPHLIRKDRTLTYDPQRDRVVAFGTTKFLDLTTKEDRDAPVDPEAAGQTLAAALAPRARELFESDDHAAAVLARVALLRQHVPEHPWPTFDDAELRDALTDAAANKRSLADLRRTGLAQSLLARLPYPLDRLLKEHAPETIEVPTGNRIRVQYSPTQPPILAVRLQELFGLPETPRIAAGRVPVLLHLLSPGYKPVQVTQDLKSFWTNTYPQVRKDLRARYPKHSWPDNPRTAQPVSKGRPTK